MSLVGVDPVTFGAVGGALSCVVKPVAVSYRLLIEFPEGSFTSVVILILYVVSLDKLSDGSIVNDLLSLVYGEDVVIIIQLLKLLDEIWKEPVQLVLSVFVVIVVESIISEKVTVMFVALLTDVSVSAGEVELTDGATVSVIV